MLSTLFRENVKDICKSALEGNLSLELFSRQWVTEYSNDDFLQIVKIDLEDGIEHIPGFIFKKGVNEKAWQKTDYFLKIYTDYILLCSDANTEIMIICREAILKLDELTQRVIEDQVNACIEREGLSTKD